jgi:hypothetical protein
MPNDLSEEFQEALEKVSSASEKMHNFLSTGEVWTKEDMDKYFEIKDEFEKVNEQFKDAAENEFGKRLSSTGFE